MLDLTSYLTTTLCLVLLFAVLSHVSENHCGAKLSVREVFLCNIVVLVIIERIRGA